VKSNKLDIKQLHGTWWERSNYKGIKREIKLYLSSAGQAEWRVKENGKVHNIGKGKWKLKNNSLELLLNWEIIKIGPNPDKSLYTIKLLSSSKLILNDAEWGSDLEFKK